MFPSPFPSKKEFYILSLQLPRPPLQRAYDILVITSIDSLGRSLKDLINIVSHLQEKSINFYSIKEQKDTNTDSGMLMFNMMGSIAEFERKLINRRIYDGVKRAKSLGKYKGHIL